MIEISKTDCGAGICLTASPDVAEVLLGCALIAALGLPETDLLEAEQRGIAADLQPVLLEMLARLATQRNRRELARRLRSQAKTLPRGESTP